MMPKNAVLLGSSHAFETATVHRLLFSLTGDASTLYFITSVLFLFSASSSGFKLNGEAGAL